MKNVITYYENPSDKEGSCNTPPNILMYQSNKKIKESAAKQALNKSNQNQSVPDESAIPDYPDPRYTVCLDYLVLVIETLLPTSVFEFIDDFKGMFKDDFEFKEGHRFSGKLYNGGWAVSSYGTHVYWEDFYKSRERGVRPTLRVSIPGQALSRIDILDLAIWLNGIKSCPILGEIRCTRMDAAFDDYTKLLFSEKTLNTAFYDHSIIQLRNHTHKAIYSGNPKVPEEFGWSHSWGSGRKQIIFYNKEAESKGRIKSHRCEVRYKEADARVAFEELLKLPMEEFEGFSVKFLSKLIVGVCEFMHFPKGREHGTRDGVRLAWWERMYRLVDDKVRFSREVTKTNFKRKKSWIEKQVAASLSQLQDVMNYTEFHIWLTDVMHLARENYSEMQRAWLHSAKKDKELGYIT